MLAVKGDLIGVSFYNKLFLVAHLDRDFALSKVKEGSLNGYRYSGLNRIDISR